MVMADSSGPMLEKFGGSDAREWEVWLEDYKTYGELKKWNNEKCVANLRFFVSGDIKDCIRQYCADSDDLKTVSVDDVSKEVVKLLGGSLDPISAVQKLDTVVYLGSVRRTLLQIQALIPVAYPTLTSKADKDQMCLLHLMKLLPSTITHELIKSGVNTLDSAVSTVTLMERADRSTTDRHTTVGRVAGEKSNSARQCFVCGQQDHIKQMCPYKTDICGRCEKRGHLGVVCRSSSANPGNGGRPAPRGSQQARFGPNFAGHRNLSNRPMPPVLPFHQQQLPPKQAGPQVTWVETAFHPPVQ